MKQVLLAQPVITKIVSMIGCEDDHRVFVLPCVFKIPEKALHLIIALFNQSYVDRDHFSTHMIVEKLLAIWFEAKAL